LSENYLDKLGFVGEAIGCGGCGDAISAFSRKSLAKSFPEFLGSNYREVTLKFCTQNFSLLSVHLLHQFRTQPIKNN
jgi:hypothetical protein